jgi:hypothetical protein
MSVSNALKISLGVAAAAAAGFVAFKTSPAFAEKVAQAGGAIKDVFAKSGEKVAQAASTVADAGSAAADAVTGAAS